MNLLGTLLHLVCQTLSLLLCFVQCVHFWSGYCCCSWLNSRRYPFILFKFGSLNEVTKIPVNWTECEISKGPSYFSCPIGNQIKKRETRFETGIQIKMSGEVVDGWIGGGSSTENVGRRAGREKTKKFQFHFILLSFADDWRRKRFWFDVGWSKLMKQEISSCCWNAIGTGGQWMNESTGIFEPFHHGRRGKRLCSPLFLLPSLPPLFGINKMAAGAQITNNTTTTVWGVDSRQNCPSTAGGKNT